jgi:hypothetical protein
MARLRSTEIAQRRNRKVQLKKLRARYKDAKSAIEKEKVATKASKIAPWLSQEEFLGKKK